MNGPCPICGEDHEAADLSPEEGASAETERDFPEHDLGGEAG